MAYRRRSEAEPSTTLDSSLYGSEPIAGDSQTRAPPASQGAWTEQSDYSDFGDPYRPSKRSPTYPFVPYGSSDAHIHRTSGRASNVFSKILKREVDDGHSFTGPNNIRHASTFDTYKSASFEDTAVWDEKAILSLDGGGIRGYSALLILQELMRAIGKIESAYACGPHKADGPAKSSYHPLTPLPSAPGMATNIKPKAKNGHEPAETESSPWLPCHYFDYVAGTSTGGLIGIMLGRLRMNIDDCIWEYENLGAQVFGHSRIFHIRSPLFWPRDKYNHKKLEDVVRDVVSRRVPKVKEFPGGRNFAFDENRCRTVVVAFQQSSKVGAENAYLFRTYKNLHKSEDPEQRKRDRNPDLAHDIPIWQVARATSAAPSYFKPAIIDGLEYVDGGFGANNPCAEIYEEVRIMNNKYKRCTSIILSIGTGKNKEARRFKGAGIHRYLNYLNFARKWASDSEQTHMSMLGAKDNFDLSYFRLNVEDGLGLMKLDEWRARSRPRTKLGELIGNVRSSSPWCRRKGRRRTKNNETHGQGNGVWKDDNEHLQNGHGTVLMNGNGNIHHTGEGAFQDSTSDAAPDNAPPPNQPDTPTEHLTSHPSSSSPSTNTNKIPPWFRPQNLTLDSIRTYTSVYLSDPATQCAIAQCARFLVDGRRGRARSDPQRWERACFGTWYQCTVPGCPRGEKVYEMRSQLRGHLVDKHRAVVFGREGGVGEEGRLEEVLDGCKIIIH